jgi:hypothetical protein
VTGRPRQRESVREGRKGNGMEGAKEGGEERMSGGPRRLCPCPAPGAWALRGLAGFGSPSGPTCNIPFRLDRGSCSLFDQENTFQPRRIPLYNLFELYEWRYNFSNLLILFQI